MKALLSSTELKIIFFEQFLLKLKILEKSEEEKKKKQSPKMGTRHVCEAFKLCFLANSNLSKRHRGHRGSQKPGLMKPATMKCIQLLRNTFVLENIVARPF